MYNCKVERVVEISSIQGFCENKIKYSKIREERVLAVLHSSLLLGLYNHCSKSPKGLVSNLQAKTHLYITFTEECKQMAD